MMVRELVGKEASQATQRYIKAHLGTSPSIRDFSLCCISQKVSVEYLSF